MNKKFSVTFLLLTVFFSVFLILANLLEVKIVDLGFMTVTGGLIVFPMSYIINDCIVEVYGFRMARFTIWLGFFMNLLAVILIQLAILLPADASWTGQAAFETTFGNTARILFASFTAMVCGSMVNAYVMSKMKIGQAGKHFSVRAVASTLFGESVDSVIFFPVAFYGILPNETILSLILAQAALKTLYEIIALPVTVRLVRLLKRKEDLDVFDYKVSYKWWKVFDFLDMKKFDDIKTVFIDLDDTIWDFTANSKVAMRMVYDKFGLQEQCPYETFIDCYLKHNSELWTLYHHGKISKDFLVTERFRVVFEECAIKFDDAAFPAMINNEYLETIVTLEKVVDGAPELLSHLKQRGPVYILSNGFKNLQYRKLQSGKLDVFIDKLVLSDDINVTKPDRRLFDYALEVVGGSAETTVMIGDNYDADILGAHNAGWKTIFLIEPTAKLLEMFFDLRVTDLKDVINFI